MKKIYPDLMDLFGMRNKIKSLWEKLVLWTCKYKNFEDYWKHEMSEETYRDTSDGLFLIFVLFLLPLAYAVFFLFGLLI